MEYYYYQGRIQGVSCVSMDKVNKFGKIEKKSIFITITIQLGKIKWWLETILMFLD